MEAHAEVADLDGAGDRPLRRDAERNRQRILAAAADLLSERGLDATLDDVARAAGVGVGTVYRRFPDKEALIEELFRDRIDAMVAMAEQALTDPDPWQALVSYLEMATEMMAANIGLRQLLMFATYGKDRVCYARDQMRPVVSKLVERAQASGDLRPDFDATDMKLIAYMLASAAEYAATTRPEVWRRYLTMLIDGLRPARETVTELPVPPLTADDLVVAMGEHGRRLGPPPLTGARRAGRGGPAAPDRRGRRLLHVQLHGRLRRAYSGALIPCIIPVRARAPNRRPSHCLHVHAHTTFARVASSACICRLIVQIVRCSQTNPEAAMTCVFANREDHFDHRGGSATAARYTVIPYGPRKHGRFPRQREYPPNWRQVPRITVR